MEDMAFDLAEVFAEGDFFGPNLVPCGRILQCTGGHVPGLGIIVDSPTEIKRAIRYLKSRGSHWVKIAATGGAFGPEGIGPVLFDKEEIRMIVDTAHTLNMKVAAHALSNAGIKQCIDEGIDTIEHGADIDEESLHKMVEKGLVLVPTLAVYDVLAHSGGVLPQLYVDKSVTVTNWQRETFQKAMDIGVKIALGTDAGSPNFGRHPSVLQEMRMMQKRGMAIPDILRAATVVPSEILNMKQHGKIEEGMVADLVGLKTNPLVSLDAFEAIDFVLKDGRRAR
jgi:imidazolonepropionase-like amidohydrolase